MPQVTTPALILHAMPYGDTSKILRLLARDYGLQSVIVKGARRPKSRAGPRLDLFVQGQATVLMKPHRELNLLTAFEMTVPRAGLGADVARFAAASALAELALRFAPVDAHPDLFDAVAAGLDALAHAPPELVGAVGLLACWGVVAALGFAPALERCAVCARAVRGPLAFSAAHGGGLCETHRKDTRTAQLGGDDAAALLALVSGRLPTPPLTARHEAAHRRLLLQFVRHHLAEQRSLPALAFWDAQVWSPASS